MFSLIIASIDRSDFLINYIKCLDYQNFNGQLLIGDSSNKKHLIKIKKFIKNQNFNFEISHYHMPNHLPHQCISKLVKKIKYEYSMWICDDDLLVVSTIIKCINFLKKNSEYSAAGGKILFVHVKNKKLTAITKYKLDSLKNRKSLSRIKKLSENYQVVQYAISRTKQMKIRYNISRRDFDKGIGAELYPTFFLAAMGKIKFFDDLFCVRQNHERRIILRSLNKIIYEKKYKKSIDIFIKNISLYLSKKQKLQFHIFRKKISKYFEIYQKNVIFKDNLKIRKKRKISNIFKLIFKGNYFILKYYYQKFLIIRNNRDMKKFNILEKFITK